jgi:hypothetical protein
MGRDRFIFRTICIIVARWRWWTIKTTLINKTTASNGGVVWRQAETTHNETLNPNRKPNEAAFHKRVLSFSMKIFSGEVEKYFDLLPNNTTVRSLWRPADVSDGLCLHHRRLKSLTIYTDWISLFSLCLTRFYSVLTQMTKAMTPCGVVTALMGHSRSIQRRYRSSANVFNGL